MLICFELTMPGVGSWDGKWSGAQDYYARVRSFRSRADKQLAAELCERGRFSYSWDDGWSASVRVREVGVKEARKIRLKSAGFCGYDWMVDSIIKNGKIIGGEA